MSKRTERNTKPTANSSAVSRNEVKVLLEDTFELSRFSGNMQKITWDFLQHLIAEDLKNAEWSSVELDVAEQCIADLWPILCDADDYVVGITPKSYEVITRHFDEVVIPKFYKAFPKEGFEFDEYKRKNAYEVIVSLAYGDTKYSFTVRSLISKASGGPFVYMVKPPYNRYEAGKLQAQLVTDNWSLLHTFLKEDLGECVN